MHQEKTPHKLFPSAFIGNTDRIYRKFLQDKLQRNFIQILQFCDYKHQQCILDLCLHWVSVVRAYIHTIDKMMLELQYTYYSRLSILLYHKCTKLLSKRNSTVLSNWKLQKKLMAFDEKDIKIQTNLGKLESGCIESCNMNQYFGMHGTYLCLK